MPATARISRATNPCVDTPTNRPIQQTICRAEVAHRLGTKTGWTPTAAKEILGPVPGGCKGLDLQGLNGQRLITAESSNVECRKLIMVNAGGKWRIERGIDGKHALSTN